MGAQFHLLRILLNSAPAWAVEAEGARRADDAGEGADAGSDQRLDRDGQTVVLFVPRQAPSSRQTSCRTASKSPGAAATGDGAAGVGGGDPVGAGRSMPGKVTSAAPTRASGPAS